MARLQKSLQDYFKIPILLEPISPQIKSMQSFINIGNQLSSQSIPLPIDDRYQLYQQQEHSQILAPTSRLNLTQKLQFLSTQYRDQWEQMEIIYSNIFVVGVYDIAEEKQEQRGLGELWENYKAKKKDEKRIVLGLIIPTTNQKVQFSEIKQSYIIIPQSIEKNQLVAFLEPWLYTCLSKAEHHLCEKLKQLQNEENNLIVFNKKQERPDAKTLKRKKKARCTKLCGDLSLLLHSSRAYKYYSQAQQLLRKSDDNIWLLSCLLGKLACYTTQQQLDSKQNLIEEVREQCLFLAKKIKIPNMQSETYFKVLKIYTQIPAKFDEIACSYAVHITNTQSNAEKFLHLVQLAQLYKQAGLIRRYASLIFQSATIVMDTKPKIGLLLLNQLKQNTKIKQWPLLYSYTLKLQIEHNSTPNSGLLHLQMLQNCSDYISFKNLQSIVQSLNFTGFSKYELPSPIKFIQLSSFGFHQSPIKPKPNRISKPKLQKQSTGLLLNWRKQEPQTYKYQQNEPIKYYLLLTNKLNTYISLKIGLKFKNQDKIYEQICNLEAGCANRLEGQFRVDQGWMGEDQLERIGFGLWNFGWEVECGKGYDRQEKRIQVYEEYPELQVIPINLQQPNKDTYKICIEQSTDFHLQLQISRNKPHLKLSQIKLSLAIYYNLDVGLQELQFQIHQHFQDNLSVTFLICKEQLHHPQHEHSKPTSILLPLANLKCHQKQIKKMQIKLEYVRTQESKYQISKQVNIVCGHCRDIWIDVEKISSPILEEEWYRSRGEGNKQLIQKYYCVKYKIQKKTTNRKVYKIKFQEQEYVLGEQQQLFVTKLYKKVHKEQIDQGQSYLREVEAHWQNYLSPYQSGKLMCKLPKHPIMIPSPITINLTFTPYPKPPSSTINLNSLQILQLNYTIESPTQTNLNHEPILLPLKYSNIKSYLISGKTKIKTTPQKTISNKLRIKFITEFQEQYVVGLLFQNGGEFWDYRRIFVS